MRCDVEIWVPVVGYLGRYEVSNLGRVRSLFDNRGLLRETPRVLQKCKIGHKPDNLYYAVNLYKDKQAKQHSVHKLVAKAFIPNTGDLPLINHKDEDTFNNHSDNLEWCTNQYNQEYSLSQTVYRFLNPTGEAVDIKNLRKFSRENMLNHAHMYQIHKGKLGSHKGWRKFVDSNTTVFTEM